MSDVLQGAPRLKVCGVTRIQDADVAASLGVDYLGLNFFKGSKRYVAPANAKQIVDAVGARVQCVGLFVDAKAEDIRQVAQSTGIQIVQLHGDEPPAMAAELAPLKVIRVFRWRSADESAPLIRRHLDIARSTGVLPFALLIDSFSEGSFGGTGRRFDWSTFDPTTIPLPYLLAGGLDPDNVAEAIATLRPWGVDVASGVESSPGIKDVAKLRSFVNAVRSAS